TRVLGWLEIKQGVTIRGIEIGSMGQGLGPAQFGAGGNMQNLAAKALVAQQSAYVLEACKAPVAVFIPLKNRRFFVNLRVKCVGIVEEIRGSGICGRFACSRIYLERLPCCHPRSPHFDYPVKSRLARISRKAKSPILAIKHSALIGPSPACY